MKRIINLSALTLCIVFCSFEWEAVDVESVTKKMHEMNVRIKNMPVYAMDVNHASYEDYTTSVAHEKLSGYFKRQNNKYHSFIAGIHTIQNATCKVVVDTAHKIIIVSDPDHALEQSFTSDDYTVLLKASSSIKKSQLAKQTQYRFEFSKTYPLAAYEMTVGVNQLPEKITNYYNQEVKKDNGTSTKPRLEITLSNWNQTPVFSTDDFNQSKYVIRKENKFVLTSAYAQTYKLLDQRVLTQKKI